MKRKLSAFIWIKVKLNDHLFEIDVLIVHTDHSPAPLIAALRLLEVLMLRRLRVRRRVLLLSTRL